MSLLLGLSLSLFFFTKESVLNVEPPLDLNEYSMKAQAMFQTKMEAKAKESEAAGQAALDEAAKVEGAVTTDSGLVFLSTEAGSGDKPKASDSVKVGVRPLFEYRVYVLLCS